MHNFKRNMLSLIFVSAALSACSDNDNNDDVIPETETELETKSYSISIVNLSNNQPMSPPAAILHKAQFSAWAVGNAASEAMERLAEGGDNSALLALQSNNPTYDASAPLPPGGRLTFTISAGEDNDLTKLTIATMLVNTNDAFSGVNSVELSELSSGQTLHINGRIYDAGTEENSELSGTMPGPADGGEGYNAINDDVTKLVTLHGGVVTSDDGHVDSVLNQSHKFDNIAMHISITAL